MSNTNTQSTASERRVLNTDEVELRISDDENPKITGYAAKYNKQSVDLGGFTEFIAPGAFDRALKTSDVRALKNHDPNLILGRTTSGTLRLKTDKIGLAFEIDMPNTSTGKDVIEEIRRGDISGCSFAFTVRSDTWEETEEKEIRRTINDVADLLDVSVVCYPAYPDTSVAVRSLDKWRGSQKQAEPEKPEIKPEEAKAEEKPADPRVPTLAEQRECEKNLRKAGRILMRNKKK